jgi:two-component system, sensor histidine kinase
MKPSRFDAVEERLLVLAPIGSDAENTRTFLARFGIAALPCESMEELCAHLAGPAGAVLVAEEALTPKAIEQLTEVLEAQPTWSDLPILLMTTSSDDAVANSRLISLFGKNGNVTLLERPFRVLTLTSAVSSVLRARRRQYEVRNLIQQRDNFLAMLAHELRNPLAPIRNGLKIMQSPLANGNRAKAFEIAERQVQHLTRLVDDLLDVARVSRGKIILKKERVDLAQVVRSALEDYQKALEDAKLSLRLEVTDSPLYVQADATRLAQALSNIINNAIKYTDAGGAITVTVGRDGENFARIAIKDTGIGMDREMLNRLFQIFSQADSTLARSRGGLGIGLALVKGFIEMHGGRVTASSEGLKKGTEIVLSLPLDKTVPASHRTLVDQRCSAARKRVLVIEDNVDSAESMRMLLELAGHELEIALDGSEGVASAAKFQPDVVICDIGLPGSMDGYAVAGALRSKTELNRTFLIALTGYGQLEDQQRAKRAGFDVHLTKPVDPAYLERLLTEIGQPS